MNMPLDDQGDVSHPVRILLRLVDQAGQLPREDMALALEARDDSDAEFQRTLRLLPVRAALQAGRLNTTKTQADNAVKILPSFAEQAGLIVRVSAANRNSPYSLTAAGRTALGAGFAAGPVAVRPQRAPLRQTRPAQGGVQTLPADVRVPQSAASVTALSPEEQAAAARLRFERTARHQVLLGKVADYLRPAFALYEGISSFDLVALREQVADDAVLLMEIKSLETDAQTQARLAVGQLLYYEHMVVSGRWPGRTILRAAVFEGPIPDYLCDFLEWLQIGAFEYSGTALRPLNNTARTIATWIEDRLRRRGSGAGP
jgi:hypothetical protein